MKVIYYEYVYLPKKAAQKKQKQTQKQKHA